MAHASIPNHICMLDGADYPSFSLTSRKDELLRENERLKALLRANNISWAPEKCRELPRAHEMKTRRSSAVFPSHQLPHLPMEIQLRIISFALKCTFPITDPFFESRREHLTKDEMTQRRQIPVQILATCKAYHEEGLKLFFNNAFVFTQVAALENFATVSHEFRSTIKQVTLRVVGKYYADEPEKRDIFHTSYHPSVHNFKSQIYGRPQGAELDHGMHAYCWQQFADFMMNLQIPSGSHHLSKLFPSLSRMRVDLVNFCEHLHYPGPNFASVLRWQTGPCLDELIMTGIPEDDPDEGPEQMFSRIVKDEGVFGSGPPVFISLVKSVKALPPLGLAVRVVRADETTRAIHRLDKKFRRKHMIAALDPADGKPPKSFYMPGRTIWKFTQDSLSDPKRKWIEFDRASGYPAHDVDMWSDMVDSLMFGSDIYDADGNAINPDTEMGDEDEEDYMPPDLVDR